MAQLSAKDLEALKQGPTLPQESKKGSVSPRVRASSDDYSTSAGAGINWTTKGGVSVDLDVDKTSYTDSDYSEPEAYSASISKQGERLSYGATARKQGTRKSFEAGFTYKYGKGKKEGGMINCRGMGKAIKGGKFIGLK
jgi:hypothetical protein